MFEDAQTSMGRMGEIIDDHVKLIEEIALGFRTRLINAGMEEHVTDHITAQLLATLIQRLLGQPDD